MIAIYCRDEWDDNWDFQARYKTFKEADEHLRRNCMWGLLSRIVDESTGKILKEGG